MTKKYEILPHRADLRVRVFGKQIKEVLENLILAMNDFLQPKIHFPKKITKREVKINSLNTKTLLVDFLNEIIYLMETHRERYNTIKIKELANNFLRVVLEGEKVEGFENQIKGATYHNLKLKKQSNSFLVVEVLFDV